MTVALALSHFISACITIALIFSIAMVAVAAFAAFYVIVNAVLGDPKAAEEHK